MVILVIELHLMVIKFLEAKLLYEQVRPSFTHLLTQSVIQGGRRFSACYCQKPLPIRSFNIFYDLF